MTNSIKELFLKKAQLLLTKFLYEDEKEVHKVLFVTLQMNSASEIFCFLQV